MEMKMNKKMLCAALALALAASPCFAPAYPVFAAEAQEVSLSTVLEDMAKRYKGTSMDWEVMDMAAYGKGNEVDKESYLAYAAEAVGTPKAQVTDFERTAIVLSALGERADAFSIDGEMVDLIDKIAVYASGSNITVGINAYVYALLAYDSGAYKLPENAVWTREVLVNYILNARHTDGGWSYEEDKAQPSDPDLTAMTMNALAPYVDQKDVKTAVDGAVILLSDMFQATGGMESWGTKNSCSAASVIAALAAVGIDAHTDPRFVKDGASLLDNLMSFKAEDNAFGFDSNVGDEISTEQCFRGLVAYYNFTQKKAAYNVYASVASQTPAKSKTPLTRGEFVRLLLVEMGETENGVPASNYFKDVAPESGVAYFVNRAYDLKLVSGRGGAVFDPDTAITQEDAAVITAKAFHVAFAKDFVVDSANVSDYALESVKGLMSAGCFDLLSGEFSPKGNVYEDWQLIFEALQK